MDEEIDLLSDHDPAKLLPFVCELMPHDPNVEELPRRYYVGMDREIPDSTDRESEDTSPILF